MNITDLINEGTVVDGMTVIENKEIELGFDSDSLKNIIFRNVTFKKFSIQQINIENVIFEKCKMIDPFVIAGCSIKGLTIDGCDIKELSIGVTYIENIKDLTIKNNIIYLLSYSNCYDIENYKMINNNIFWFMIGSSLVYIRNSEIRDNEIRRALIEYLNADNVLFKDNEIPYMEIGYTTINNSIFENMKTIWGRMSCTGIHTCDFVNCDLSRLTKVCSEVDENCTYTNTLTSCNND